MPWSAEEGREWMRERIVALRPDIILDVGPGAGAYATLLNRWLPDTYFIGLEIHEPYVDRFQLRQLYDEIVIGDVRDRLGDFPVYDVVILGDVLEHLPHDDAVTVWNEARRVARTGVFLSLPIYGYEQGECEGNPHEAHLHQWSDQQVCAELDGIVDHRCWSIVGTYQAVPSS